jgi:DNA-binding NarL/FixJ family response regulator
LKPFKIFIIDDDAFFLKTVREYFAKNQSGNYEFYYYSSGERAILESYRNPTLVIVDYYLDTNQPDADNGLRIINGFHVLLPKAKLLLISKTINAKLLSVSKELGYFECFEKNKLLFDLLKQKLDNLIMPNDFSIIERLKAYLLV